MVKGESSLNVKIIRARHIKCYNHVYSAVIKLKNADYFVLK